VAVKISHDAGSARHLGPVVLAPGVEVGDRFGGTGSAHDVGGLLE